MSDSRRFVLKTSRFQVEQTETENTDGSSETKHIIRHPGSVVIVPILDDGRICLIKNYRISVNEALIELPAGTLAPSEVPKACAVRELAEETGFVSSTIVPLMEFFAAPGILDEKMHLFLASDLRPGPPHREVDERIENFIVPLDDAFELVRNNQIRDAKTIAGLLYYDRFHN